MGAGRLSPPLTLAVAYCVALGKLLGLSGSQVCYACTRGLDWTDSTLLPSLKLGHPPVLVLSTLWVYGGVGGGGDLVGADKGTK